MKKHMLRIVGGEYRRTPIPVVSAPGLRPTPDRVRETLFNWLTHLWQGRFDNKSVLDLFAGSGALGFEAASRGVAHVQMVEKNPQAIARLRAVRDKLNAMAVRIHAGDATQVLKRLEAARFDLVFLDPPFGQGWFDQLWPALPDLLTSTGLVYIESEQAISPPPEFELIRESRAGDVFFYLLRFADVVENDNNRGLQ